MIKSLSLQRNSRKMPNLLLLLPPIIRFQTIRFNQHINLQLERIKRKRINKNIMRIMGSKIRACNQSIPRIPPPQQRPSPQRKTRYQLRHIQSTSPESCWGNIKDRKLLLLLSEQDKCSSHVRPISIVIKMPKEMISLMSRPISPQGQNWKNIGKTDIFFLVNLIKELRLMMNLGIVPRQSH